MKFRVAAFVPLALILLIGIAFAVGLRNDPRSLPTTMINHEVPPFTLAPVLPGSEPFTRSDLMGQVSLVNVFGSWCTACRVEHPVLMRLSREENVIIYGIDWRDTAENGTNWLRKYGNPYQKVGLDAQSVLAIGMGVTGAPETFIVDTKGHIRFKQVGPITDEVWRDTIAPLIVKLEAES